jgi:antitoxin component of MazEF toxin-antitoxin module
MKMKLRKIGNSYGVILPNKMVKSFIDTGEIDLILAGSEVTHEITVGETPEVITSEVEEFRIVRVKPFNFEKCKKHHGTYKGTCGCK